MKFGGNPARRPRGWKDAHLRREYWVMLGYTHMWRIDGGDIYQSLPGGGKRPVPGFRVDVPPLKTWQ